MKVIPIVPERSCDGCTKCCDGWLTGTIYGHKMYPSMKRHYVSEKGCSIYLDRPEDPCKKFQCMWLTDDIFPLWMKPSLIDTIFVKKQIDGIDYISIHEAGKKMDSKVLWWIFTNFCGKNNVLIQIEGNFKWVGSPKFNEKMSEIHNSKTDSS